VVVVAVVIVFSSVWGPCRREKFINNGVIRGLMSSRTILVTRKDAKQFQKKDSVDDQALIDTIFTLFYRHPMGVRFVVAQDDQTDEYALLELNTKRAPRTTEKHGTEAVAVCQLVYVCSCCHLGAKHDCTVHIDFNPKRVAKCVHFHACASGLTPLTACACCAAVRVCSYRPAA